MRTMMSGKIHRATVTEANVDYEGSITIDKALMEAADMLPFEQVHVLDVDNGARLETYIIEGERGSGVICINGAAARLIHEGDKVIIIAYQNVSQADALHIQPKVVFVDEKNRIAHKEKEKCSPFKVK